MRSSSLRSSSKRCYFCTQQHGTSFKDTKTTKQFLDGLSDKLGYKHLEDWYNIKYQDIISNEGQHIVTNFGSLVNSLKSSYPSHNWIQYKFQLAPTDYWDLPT